MKIKIALAVATAGTIKSKTAFSLIETVRLNPGIEMQSIFTFSGYIAENKNRNVENAQKLLCSHIFFIDHDMKFPPQTLPKLLSYDKDIVGALYYYKQLPLEPMLKYFDFNGEWTAKLEGSTLGIIPTELFKTAAVGGGMMLVKMSVFEKLKRPYFTMEQDEEGNRSMTEDCGFLLQAQKAGFEVWCDPSLGIKHLGEYEF